MSEQLRESISALMDGEAGELEIRRVLAESGNDEVRQSWSRYHMVRRTMQGEHQQGEFDQFDISKKISAAIADEPVVKSRSWLRPTASMAVAASVAVAVIVGVQGFTPTQNLDAPLNSDVQTVASNRVYSIPGGGLQASISSSTSPSAPVSSVYTQGNAAVATLDEKAEIQKRFNQYILRHTEQASLANKQGMISYARVVNYEPNK